MPMWHPALAERVKLEGMVNKVFDKMGTTDNDECPCPNVTWQKDMDKNICYELRVEFTRITRDFATYIKFR